MKKINKQTYINIAFAAIVLVLLVVIAILVFSNKDVPVADLDTAETVEKNETLQPTPSAPTVEEAPITIEPDEDPFNFNDKDAIFAFILENADALNFPLLESNIEAYDFTFLDFTLDGLDDVIVKHTSHLGLIFVTQENNQYALVKTSTSGLNFGGNEYDFEYTMSNSILSIRFTDSSTEHIVLAHVTDNTLIPLETLTLYEPYDYDRYFPDPFSPYRFYKEEAQTIIELDNYDEFIALHTFEILDEASDFRIAYLKAIEHYKVNLDSSNYTKTILTETQYLDLNPPQSLSNLIDHNSNEVYVGDIFAGNVIKYLRYEPDSFNIDLTIALQEFINNDYYVTNLLDEDPLMTSLLYEAVFYVTGKPFKATLIVEKQLFYDMDYEYYEAGASVISFNDPTLTLDIIRKGLSFLEPAASFNNIYFYSEIPPFIDTHYNAIMDGTAYEVEVLLNDIILPRYYGGTYMPELAIKVEKILSSKIVRP